MFLADPVPRRLVEESLELGMLAPSNSNVQPWQVVFASGRVGTGWSRPCRRRRVPKRPTSRNSRRSSPTCAANWAHRSTARWESPATTARRGAWPCCADDVRRPRRGQGRVSPGRPCRP
ncbi:nitroreductase family protein [Mycobacterium servetii]|uniref:Nitroreductase family protein n=1 Tax=Mycobacterium servetii TaxID=3237418 RepID=A0ABV4C5M7_9MYCO